MPCTRVHVPMRHMRSHGFPACCGRGPNAMEEVLATALRHQRRHVLMLEDLQKQVHLHPPAQCCNASAMLAGNHFHALVHASREDRSDSPPPQLTAAIVRYAMSLSCSWRRFLGGRRSSLSGCTLRTRRPTATPPTRAPWRSCLRGRGPQTGSRRSECDVRLLDVTAGV